MVRSKIRVLLIITAVSTRRKIPMEGYVQKIPSSYFYQSNHCRSLYFCKILIMKKIILLLVTACIAVCSFAQLTPEQKQVRQTFFNFLDFYRKHEAKFNSFVLYKGNGKDNAPPYRVQWKEAENYFSYLRSNVPYVGKAYIEAERAHFKYSDSCFKANPAEEIAAGFDYDRWAGGQESIKYTYKWYTSPKNKYIVIITGNTALLKIDNELLEDAQEKDRSWSFVPFVKENGRWKMADNIYPVSEEN